RIQHVVRWYCHAAARGAISVAISVWIERVCVGRAEGVVPDELIDVVVVPRAVPSDPEHSAWARPLETGVRIVGAAVDRQRHFVGHVERKRGAPRLVPLALGPQKSPA